MKAMRNGIAFSLFILVVFSTKEDVKCDLKVDPNSTLKICQNSVCPTLELALSFVPPNSLDTTICILGTESKAVKFNGSKKKISFQNLTLTSSNPSDGRISCNRNFSMTEMSGNSISFRGIYFDSCAKLFNFSEISKVNVEGSSFVESYTPFRFDSNSKLESISILESSFLGSNGKLLDLNFQSQFNSFRAELIGNNFLSSTLSTFPQVPDVSFFAPNSESELTVIDNQFNNGMIQINQSLASSSTFSRNVGGESLKIRVKSGLLNMSQNVNAEFTLVKGKIKSKTVDSNLTLINCTNDFANTNISASYIGLFKNSSLYVTKTTFNSETRINFESKESLLYIFECTVLPSFSYQGSQGSASFIGSVFNGKHSNFLTTNFNPSSFTFAYNSILQNSSFTLFTDPEFIPTGNQTKNTYWHIENSVFRKTVTFNLMEGGFYFQYNHVYDRMFVQTAVGFNQTHFFVFNEFMGTETNHGLSLVGVYSDDQFLETFVFGHNIYTYYGLIFDNLNAGSFIKFYLEHEVHRQMKQGIFFGSSLKQDIQGLYVTNCSFHGLGGEEGSQRTPMELEFIKEVEITHCDFRHHRVASAAALFISNTVTTSTVTFSHFSDNSAAYQASDVVIAGSLSSATNFSFNEVYPFKIYLAFLYMENSVLANNYIQCPNFTRIYSNISKTNSFISCRPCVDSTYTLSEGKILQNNSIVNPECNTCPEIISVCQPTTGNVYINDGWWCHNQNFQSKLECFQCPTGYCSSQTHLWKKSCSPNRTGLFCSECKKDHTESFLGSSCVPEKQCHPSYWLIFIVFPLIFVTIFVFFGVGSSSEFKSFAHVIQIFPLLVTTNPITIIPSVIYMQAYLNAGGDTISDYFWRFCFKAMDATEKNFWLLLLTLSAPLAAFLLFVAMRCVRLVRKRYDKKYHSIVSENSGLEDENYVFSFFPGKEVLVVPLWGRFLQASLSLYIFFYSNLVLLFTSSFHCVDIFAIEQKPMRLFTNASVECRRPWQWGSMIVFGIFILPFPAFLIVLRVILRRKYKKNAVAASILHLLESSYWPKFRWWESYSLMRNLALIFTYVFILDGYWRVVALSLLNLLFTAIQAFIRPMRSNVGNHLETFCLGALTGSCILERADDKWYDAANAGQMCLIGAAMGGCIAVASWNSFTALRRFIEDRGFLCLKKKRESFLLNETLEESEIERT